jgi:hypothetical protein
MNCSPGAAPRSATASNHANLSAGVPAYRNRFVSGASMPDSVGHQESFSNTEIQLD